MRSPRQQSRDGPPTGRRGRRTDWDGVADWYDGWVGRGGSHYHRRVALPTVLELRRGESVLDVGSGQGVLAPHIRRAGGAYLGVEVSPKLLKLARRRHGDAGRFVRGDARALGRSVAPASADAAVFLFSIQDMDPLEAVLAGAATALRSGGRLVVFMIHPCFRVPRQSGWSYDGRRKLASRRIDRYLSPLAVPMTGSTRSFHRPLQSYLGGLIAAGFTLDRFREIPDDEAWSRRQGRPFNADIPLFLALRAWRR